MRRKNPEKINNKTEKTRVFLAGHIQDVETTLSTTKSNLYGSNCGQEGGFSSRGIPPGEPGFAGTGGQAENRA